MDFDYKKIPIIDFKLRKVIDYVYRPIIKIGIKNEPNGKSEFVDYEVLIDSGADECIFPIELADVSGIIVDKSKKNSFIGLGGDSVIGYKTKISLNLGGIKFISEVYFCEDFKGHGILGQKGFFDKFRVRFIYSKKKIEISEEK